jgi:formylglycine-generating enzyme required for sulfatase activity
MLVVPAGWFMMGSNSAPDEKPVHRVTIAEPFAVGRYEVAFEEWDACVADGGCGSYRPSDKPWGRGRRPVFNVSWNDAQEYVRWISHKTEKRYRLLTEAEWEYVARAGTRTNFWWGSAPGDNHGNCVTCRKPFDPSGTTPVGSFRSNGFGLYDTEGNVKEWVEDCWQPSYNDEPTNGSARATERCERRVDRGMSWNIASYYISSYRDWNRPNNRNPFIGFRVARTLD